MKYLLFISLFVSPFLLRWYFRMCREERFYRRMEEAFRNANDRNDRNDHDDKTD